MTSARLEALADRCANRAYEYLCCIVPALSREGLSDSDFYTVARNDHIRARADRVMRLHDRVLLALAKVEARRAAAGV